MPYTDNIENSADIRQPLGRCATCGALLLVLLAAGDAQVTVLPDAQTSREYSAQLSIPFTTVAGPVYPPIRCSVDKTLLPKEMAVEDSCLLHNTPTASRADAYVFTVKETDSKGTVLAEAMFSLKVNNGIPIIEAKTQVSATPAPVRITIAPHEGESTLEVAATPSSQIEIQDDRGFRISTKNASMKTDSNGLLTVSLQDPLDADQGIVVQQTPPPGVTTDKSLLKSSVSRVDAATDWGRVRGYFTAGALLSNDNSSFSQSNTFLDFTIDKNWIWVGDSCKRNFRRYGLNSYFTTRLTAIPVATLTQPNAPTNTLQNFLSSRKAASFLLGIYAPVLMTHWEYHNTSSALFLAPILKAGFSTPTENVDQTANGTAVTAVNPSHFYNFGAGGLRVGHYHLSHHEDVAPDIYSYLDMTIGKFSNLETQFEPADRSDPSKQMRIRRFRLALEGVLKIPNSPFIVGLSANVGPGGLPGNKKIFRGLSQKIDNIGKDDLRFLFGVKFDAIKLMRALVPQF